MSRSVLPLFVACLLAVGCSTPQPVSEPEVEQIQDDAASYASALREAFEVYADEVYTAALFDYTSVAEAEAVVRTLSGRRFDYQLSLALERRGLSVRGLSDFAEKNPTFFHEQQRQHWGKLQELEATLASIPLKVKPAAVAVDDSLAAM